MRSFSTNSMLSMAPPRRIYMMHGINSKNFGSNSTYLGDLGAGETAETTGETHSTVVVQEAKMPWGLIIGGMVLASGVTYLIYKKR